MWYDLLVSTGTNTKGLRRSNGSECGLAVGPRRFVIVMPVPLTLTPGGAKGNAPFLPLPVGQSSDAITLVRHVHLALRFRNAPGDGPAR